jgi:D-alanyl-D-alanine dipeptidase
MKNANSRAFFWLIPGPLLLLVCASSFGLPSRLALPTDEIVRCEQMILVVTPDWKAATGRVQLLERLPAGRWTAVRPSFPCVVGKNGLGWGIGLHGTGRPGDPQKREGDGRAPAGVFRLNSCLGIGARNHIFRFPYRRIKATTEAVYDSKSVYYNRVVDRDLEDRVDWVHAERMLSNRLYRWVVVVEHNWKPYPGFGSCIFLHLWPSQGHPTIGCTAMNQDNLDFLVHWLNASKHPLLVQLPQPVYQNLKQRWTLP